MSYRKKLQNRVKQGLTQNQVDYIVDRYLDDETEFDLLERLR